MRRQNRKRTDANDAFHTLCVSFAAQGEKDTQKKKSAMRPQAKRNACVGPKNI
jgi:hypothetical protein